MNDVIFCLYAFARAVLGYVADVYLGRFNTIVVFGIVYLSGLFILAGTAFASSVPGAAVGLALTALGGGAIKSNVGPFGAEQLDDFQSEEASATFWLSWFVCRCFACGRTVQSWGFQALSFNITRLHTVPLLPVPPMTAIQVLGDQRGERRRLHRDANRA